MELNVGIYGMKSNYRRLCRPVALNKRVNVATRTKTHAAMGPRAHHRLGLKIIPPGRLELHSHTTIKYTLSHAARVFPTQKERTQLQKDESYGG